jgi:hypothetical protein
MACLKSMLKKFCIILFLIGVCSLSKAQFLGGIFNQNATMIENMIQQIALLQTYIGYVEKGYNIVNKGLTLIGDIKRDDFNLHNDFFNAFEAVSPKIKSDAKIATMIAMQLGMIAQYKSFLNDFTKSGVFTGGEIVYITSVFTNLLNEVMSNISNLTDLVTDGMLKMNDAERTKSINEIYAQTSGQYELLYTFGNEVKLQEEQRTRELQDIGTIQKIY